MSDSTILLVIDDPGFRGPLMAALRNRGMRPVLMGDGEQARGFLASESPSLVVVDPRIPGGGGVAWIRARRAEGHRVPMVLCATTRDEAQALLLQADELGIASVIPKAAPPDTLAAHFEELLAPPSPGGESDGGAVLAAAVEAVRVSIVNLQKNAESLDRMSTTLDAARRLRVLAGTFRAEACTSAAKTIEDLIVQTQDGRSRLDNSAFVVIEKVLVRAREEAGTVTSAPPPEARRPSASAHGEDPPAEPAARTQLAPRVDQLTGVYTRDAFLREADERVTGAMVDGRPLSFCVVGIDGADALRAARRFDAVLEQIGKFLLSRFRPDDVRGRWMPDAFALAFPGTPSPMAVANMTRTLDAFASLQLAAADGTALTLSIGVATYPKEGHDAAAALQTAEQRMRAAQKRGGGTVVG